MAEGGGLLNRYTLSRRIEGSNPSVSAREPFALVDAAMARPQGASSQSDSVFRSKVGRAKLTASRRVSSFVAIFV